MFLLPSVCLIAAQDSIFEYPWNNFLHSSVEQAIYTLLTPESSIYSAQNLSRAANSASSRNQLITDLEADAEFDFDLRPSPRGAGGAGAGGGLATNRESGRSSGRDELEHFLGGSPTDPKASPLPESESAHVDGSAPSTGAAEQTASANGLAHSNSDAPRVQSAAEAHSLIVSHVCSLF